MATWTTPKTDWQGTDYFTASDWGRIVNNAQYILDEISLPISLPSPSATDGQTVLTPSDRNAVTSALYRVLHQIYSSWNRGYVADRVNFGSAWNSTDLNIIESIERDIKAQLDGDLPQNDFYRAGDELACGDTISVGLL